MIRPLTIRIRFAIKVLLSLAWTHPLDKTLKPSHKVPKCLPLRNFLQLKDGLESLHLKIQQLGVDLHSFFLYMKEEGRQPLFSNDEGQCGEGNEVTFDQSYRFFWVWRRRIWTLVLWASAQSRKMSLLSKRIKDNCFWTRGVLYIFARAWHSALHIKFLWGNFISNPCMVSHFSPTLFEICNQKTLYAILFEHKHAISKRRF